MADPALGLAILLHDPPWKPWGIKRKRVKGCLERESIWACMAKKLAEREDLGRRAKEAAKEALSKYKKYAKKKKKKKEGRESHELQGALVLRILASELEEQGLSDLAKCVREAEDRVLTKDVQLAEADRRASAIDRLLLYAVERTLGKSLGEAELFLVNPFNPKLKIYLHDTIDVNLIVNFVAIYASTVTEVLAKARKTGKWSSCEALIHVAYALLEPTWYRAADRTYIPPADTRMPTHTVFDHVNAALAAANWLGGRGCVAVVDLAGVWEWIMESRRLRDLWAASWLASWLAWSSVEELVEDYGPGILIQPPARLNPLYSAWLASKLGHTPEGLWLPENWPIDPTLPTRITLALPPEACEDLEGRVRSGYERAWRKVVAGLKDLLSEACREGGEGIVCNVVDKVDRLPPPLAQRVVKVHVKDAESEARKLYEKMLKDSRIPKVLRRGEGKRRFVEASYYPLALLKLLPEEEARLQIRLLARFATKEYLEYARVVWSIDNGSKARLCTVCGKAYAIVDGKEIPKDVHARGLCKLLAGEVKDERLCPYCLAKRLLRTLLEKGRFTPFPGLDFGRVEEKLRSGTVDRYSSRTLLAYDTLKRAVEIVAECYSRRTTQFVNIVLNKNALRHAFLVANSFLEDKDRKRIANSLGLSKEKLFNVESVVLEAAHYEKAFKELREVLESTCRGGAIEQLSRTWEVRRKVAILRLNGDFIDRRLLRGVLSLNTDEYINMASAIAEEEARRELSAAVGSLAESIRSAAKDSLGYDLELTIPPTLSYHFTVSRALAAQAARDRSVIEGHGGFLIYAGGDDLLAIMPPAAWGGAGLARPLALLASYELRRSYWAVEDEGFSVVRDGRGIVHSVVPAPAVYGRSGSLLYVDSIHPLWASLRLSLELEESKDGSRLLEGRNVLREKDVLVIASDAGGVAVLPQYTLPEPPSKQNLGWTGTPILLAAALSELTSRRRGGGETPLSGSLLSDALDYVGPLAKAAEMGRDPVPLAATLIARNLECRKRGDVNKVLSDKRYGMCNVGCGPRGNDPRMGAEELLRSLASKAGLDEGRLVALKTEFSGKAGELARTSGFSTTSGCGEGQQLLVALLASARAFRSSI